MNNTSMCFLRLGHQAQREHVTPSLIHVTRHPTEVAITAHCNNDTDNTPATMAPNDVTDINIAILGAAKSSQRYT